jgi:tetratricopeptide (TPR) repeat protein
MRFLRVLILLIFPLSLFAQTESYIEDLKNTPADSISKLEVLGDLLNFTVSYEYPDSLAWEQYNNIGMIFYSKNLPSQAGRFFMLAHDKAKSVGYFDDAAQMLSNAGVILEMSGDYLGAIENYQKALKEFSKTGNLKAQSLVYNNIAIVHQELDNDELAYDNLKKSFDLKIKTGDSTLIASGYNNFGVFYEEQRNNLDSALYCYFKAKQIYIKLGDKRNEAICENNIANLLFQTGDYENARRSFRQTIEKFRNTEDNLWLSRALMYLGQLELKEGNISVAVGLLAESVQILSGTDYSRYLMEASGSLAQAYFESGDYKNSALMFKQYVNLKDSILNSEKQSEIRKLEVKYQSVQKDLEIAQLNEDNYLQQKRNERILYLVLFITIFLSFIIVIIWMKSRHRKLVLQNTNMQIKQQLLQNQMNPHFLFNVLTSIQNFVKNNDNDNASGYLSDFSRLTRIVLQSSAMESISLETEIELLTKYLKLEQLRLNNSFDFEIEPANFPEADEIKIPPMMVQPFVENAVKHGLPIDKKGLIKIIISEKSGYIIFEVEDNGGGLNIEKSNSSHVSMSTGIIKERTEILKQKFNKDVSVNYEKCDIGTKVVVKLPEIF